MKALQIFTDEYLEQCRHLTPDQIVKFLDDFRHVAHAGQGVKKCKLISIKVPEDLLDAFRLKAKLKGRPYQAAIKDAMRSWLLAD